MSRSFGDRVHDANVTAALARARQLKEALDRLGIQLGEGTDPSSKFEPSPPTVGQPGHDRPKAL